MRMLRLCSVVTLELLAATVGLTQSAVPTREAEGYQAIRESDLRADLGFISSDALQGRMSLTPGDEVAVQWIAAELAKAALKPAFGNSYLQPVPLIEYRADGRQSYLTIKQSGAEKRLQFPDIAGGFKRDVDVSGEVQFAGFGITAPGLAYDDYKGINARGKVVLVFNHEPQETDPASIFNGTGNTLYATTRVKALNAQAHGAVAMLALAEPNRKHPSTQELIARIGGSATRKTPPPSQALAQEELDIPVVLVSDAVARELMQSSGVTPGDAQTAIDRNLQSQSRALPGTVVELHLRNIYTRTGTTWNVGGILEGSSPELRGETVIVSAHHDHEGATEEGVFHGADDNGSGMVGVVELARAFAGNPEKPKRSILFVVFGAEERGLLGAYYLAAHPVRPLATTRAMINFDMIGRNEEPTPQTEGVLTIPADTANRLDLIGGAYSPEYRRIVEEQNRLVGLVLDDRFDHESALNIFFRSDHFPFVLHNVPAFWWFTGFHPDYHHITDTADRINYSKMARILRLAYLSAWQFGDNAQVPSFVQNPKGRP
jgi:Peptidase family M28/PA domain